MPLIIRRVISLYRWPAAISMQPSFILSLNLEVNRHVSLVYTNMHLRIASVSFLYRYPSSLSFNKSSFCYTKCYFNVSANAEFSPTVTDTAFVTCVLQYTHFHCHTFVHYASSLWLDGLSFSSISTWTLFVHLQYIMWLDPNPSIGHDI